MLGLCPGVAGVVVLAGSGEDQGTDGVGGLTEIALPFVTPLVATAFYGLAANFARRFLKGVSSLAVATGSQVSASLMLLLPGMLLRSPDVVPSVSDWLCVVVSGTLCKGVAYLLYIHLIGSVGATHAAAVTFVIPIFGVSRGAWLLGEHVDTATVARGLIIVPGTALTTAAPGAHRGRAET